MKKIALLIIAIPLFLYSGSCVSQAGQLPLPSGDFSIGIEYFSFPDSERIELFDNEADRSREITVKAWYPVDQHDKTVPYLADVDFAIQNFGFPESYRSLRANGKRGLPVSDRQHVYPVLIFSHGWGEHFSQNTLLMEELASHGYIVLSIAHHYECKFSFYPDGRPIGMDMESIRFRQLLEEQQNPRAIEVFTSMFRAENDDERKAVFSESSELMPMLLVESPKYWAGDIEFVISKLPELNRQSPVFKDHIDLNRIGVFGMSMGGIATNEICSENSGVKAGINIDGGMYGSILEKPLETPFLFINSQRYLGYGNLFVGNTEEECYSITINNSDHYNFSDYAVYPMPNQPMLGTIDPQIPIRLMNAVVLAFFDRYVAGRDAKSMEDIVEGYDVEYCHNQ